jgi:L-asparaginase II
MDAAGFASCFVPLWVGDRGGHPDFVRLGAWVACDAGGRRVAGAGDAALPAFLRSSAKPFQAIAFLRRGLDERLALRPVEIACACASHEGEPAHVAAARRILAAAGIDEAALLCGTHAAGNAELERQVARGEVTLQPIHNNCSGKHSAMLATCRHEGWALGTYTERDHPLQLESLATLATFAGLAASDVIVGVDNCTVPTFALPLHATARAFARLMDPRGVPEPLARAAAVAVAAMTAQPFMVGGTNRLDTLLMERTRGRVMVKTGANGFHGGCGRRSDGSVLGFALKLSGAEGEAQKAPAVIHALRSCGLLLEDEARDLLDRFATPQLNCRGAIVGGGTPVAPPI